MKNSDKILGIFNEMMEGKRSQFATLPYTEDAKGEKEEKDEKKEAGTDLMDFEGEKDDKEKDSQDKADDVIKKVDLKGLDNQAKVELIGTIIETLQNDVESDDEFSEFMNKIVKLVDGYKFEKEGEKEEKKEKKEDKEEKKEDKEEKKEDKGEEKKEDKEKEGEKE